MPTTLKPFRRQITNNYIYILHIYIYRYIHTHIRVCIYIYIHTHIHIHMHNDQAWTHPTCCSSTCIANLEHAIAGWVLFTVKTNIEKAIKIPYKSNIQGNNIMEKSFTHCTVDVMSLVRSNRSGFHYFIAPTQNLSRMVASSCYIHSRSTTRSLRPCSTNVSSLYCQKSSFL